jgi:hypothetical protein
MISIDIERPGAGMSPMTASVHAAHLAQLNVATLLHPLDDSRMAPFVEMLDPVNTAADGTPGFVWRLVEDGGADATALRPRPAGEHVIVNLTVWETQEALWDFTYRSGHLEVLRRRHEWFERHVEAHLVLWWVPPATPHRRRGPGTAGGPAGEWSVPARVHLRVLLHRRRGPPAPSGCAAGTALAPMPLPWWARRVPGGGPGEWFRVCERVRVIGMCRPHGGGPGDATERSCPTRASAHRTRGRFRRSPPRGSRRP